MLLWLSEKQLEAVIINVAAHHLSENKVTAMSQTSGYYWTRVEPATTVSLASALVLLFDFFPY